MKPLSPRKNNYYTFLCTCACMSMYVCVGGSTGADFRVWSLTYPACNAHAPYCLRPLWLHHIFRHYLINDTIFGKKSYWTRSMCLFSLQLLSETFLILRRIQRDIVINVKASLCKVLLHSRRTLMKLEFSWQIFEKSWNIKYNQNPSSGSRVVPCGGEGRGVGRADAHAHDEANTRFQQFC
jgi:hypothetical protein